MITVAVIAGVVGVIGGLIGSPKMFYGSLACLAAALSARFLP